MDLFITLLIVLIALYLIGNITFKIMFERDFRRPDINKKGQKEGADMEGGFPKDFLLENEAVKDIYIESEDGLSLHGLSIESAGSHKWAVIMHGYTSNAEYYAAYAEHYVRSGYNVLLPESRAHGKSQGRFIGMGYPERLDLIKWCEYINSQDSSAQILLHGMSMGATTALFAAGEEKLPHNIACIIADSGYTSSYEVMYYQLKNTMHLPAAPLLALADTVNRMKCGYSMKENNITSLQKTCIPILFIHGKKDDFVPMAIHEELYAAASGPKDRLIINEGHIMGRYHQEELYWQTADGFAAQYMK